jgi:hypothetical protein
MGNRVGSVSQVEPARDVLDDVLDRPPYQKELPRDLVRLEAFGEQLQLSSDATSGSRPSR